MKSGRGRVAAGGPRYLPQYVFTARATTVDDGDAGRDGARFIQGAQAYSVAARAEVDGWQTDVDSTFHNDIPILVANVVVNVPRMCHRRLRLLSVH